MIRNFVFIVSALLLTACVSQKDLVYIKNIDTSEKIIKSDSKHKELVFGTGDMLLITVDGLDRESVRPFNLQENQGLLNTYLVDSKGNILFPIIGKIQVNGLTKEGLIQLLTEKLTPYLKNPTIMVQLENFQVSVLGEVHRPGKYSTKNDRITILEALSMAGDITTYGKKRNVLITREQNGQIEFARLDLTNPNIFTSKYYYLKQNDVIYVEPSSSKPLGTPSSIAQLSIASIAVSIVTSIILFVKN